MKIKATRITSILAIIIALLSIGQIAKAQNFGGVPTTNITPINQNVDIDVPAAGGPCVVSNTGGGYLNIKVNQGNNNIHPPFVNISTNGRVSCLTRKIGHTDEFWGLVNGELYLFNIYVVANHLVVNKIKSLYTFTIGSDGYLQVEGDALYINDGGIIGVSRDTGVTWTIDTSGLGYISWFSMDTAQNVYAVNQSHTALYYQNANITNVWHKMGAFPVGVNPQYVYIDRRNRFFVGTNGHGVYYSYDTGHTWTQGITGLAGVNCANMNDDAFGNIYLINGLGLNIYRSVNGGATWTEPPGDTGITNRSSFLSNAFNLINCVSGDTVLNAATQFGLYFSKDSGKTWVQNDTGLAEGTLNGFWKFANGRLLETSGNGVFWLNKGDSIWHKPLPTNGYGTAGIVLADTIGNVYVNNISSGVDASTMKSADNGTTWQTDTLGNYLVTGPWWVDQYGIEHNVNTDFSSAVSIVYKKTGNNPYVLDTAGIGFINGSIFYGVNSFGSDGAGYLYMSGKLTPAPNILRRPILGGKWVADTTGSAGLFFAALAHDANHNMIASPLWLHTGIYYRKAGIWTSMPYPSAIPSYDNVAAIACDNTGGTLVAFTGYDFVSNSNIGTGVYCTQDYGMTWNYVGLDTVYVNQLVNCGGDTTYALTTGQGVYRLVCSGVITSSPSTKSISKLENSVSLYPNPNNGNFTLEYKLPVNSGEFRILDIMGKVVYTSNISNREGKQNIDASLLNNGIYLWEVFSGNGLVDKGKIAVMK